ncbi:hypothetical protein C3L33_23297, partial [Rhododendron williamsianum]
MVQSLAENQGHGITQRFLGNATVSATKGQDFVWFRDGYDDRQPIAGNMLQLVFIDGAWTQDGLKAGAAWVVKDVNGLSVHEGKCGFIAHSAPHAEYRACYEALAWCFKNNFLQVKIHTDSSLLVGRHRLSNDNAILSIANKAAKHTMFIYP